MRISIISSEVPDQTSVPIPVQMLLKLKDFDLLNRALAVLDKKPASLSFALAISKAHQNNSEEMIKHFSEGVSKIVETCNQNNDQMESSILRKPGFNAKFSSDVHHVDDPGMHWACMCIEELEKTNNTNIVFDALNFVLTLKKDKGDPSSNEIIDKLFSKLYELSKRQKDSEIAFVCATSISQEHLRKTALGRLIEDLIHDNRLSELFNCRLTNKNLMIVISYLK